MNETPRCGTPGNSKTGDMNKANDVRRSLQAIVVTITIAAFSNVPICKRYAIFSGREFRRTVSPFDFPRNVATRIRLSTFECSCREHLRERRRSDQLRQVDSEVALGLAVESKNHCGKSQGPEKR